VSPIVVYLASRTCDFSHHCFSAVAGRYSRVFAGLSEGWLSPAGSVPAAEDIQRHLAEMSATDTFVVPTSIFDEVFEICRRRGISI
jgi:hypothetical protein